ncbi:hypothetical protein Tco_0838278 [Tanacetum coccineum]|uniref:Uncharacterized protein n=1 Tax=Tanacetum coccineum TaxID=301880 RepID=A0ABQ5AMB5_9ASTR
MLAPPQSALFPILTFSPFVSYLRTSTLTSGNPWQCELVDVIDHEMSYFLFQCAPSSLRQVLHVDILGNVKPG